MYIHTVSKGSLYIDNDELTGRCSLLSCFEVFPFLLLFYFHSTLLCDETPPPFHGSVSEIINNRLFAMNWQKKILITNTCTCLKKDDCNFFL